MPVENQHIDRRARECTRETHAVVEQRALMARLFDDLLDGPVKYQVALKNRKTHHELRSICSDTRLCEAAHSG